MAITMQRPLLLVGCGKMGGALLSGWRDRGIAGGGITVVEPVGVEPAGVEPAGIASGGGNVRVVASPDDLPAGFDPEVVVFAVKPQQMGDAAPSYAAFAGPGTVFLSIAAGLAIAWFEARLGTGAAVVRAMPNTPAAIGQGITVAAPNAKATPAQRELCRALLQAVGEAVMVDDEALLDAVTATSGGGPAYVFLLIECLAEAAAEAGLPRDLADRLALVTVAGAGQLALASKESPAKLRENVTSPGGTTLEALKVLTAKDGLQPLMTRAIAAATRRSRELAG